MQEQIALLVVPAGVVVGQRWWCRQECRQGQLCRGSAAGSGGDSAAGGGGRSGASGGGEVKGRGVGG